DAPESQKARRAVEERRPRVRSSARAGPPARALRSPRVARSRGGPADPERDLLLPLVLQPGTRRNVGPLAAGRPLAAARHRLGVLPRARKLLQRRLPRPSRPD